MHINNKGMVLHMLNVTTLCNNCTHSKVCSKINEFSNVSDVLSIDYAGENYVVNLSCKFYSPVNTVRLGGRS